jgi:hypothetical protein
MSQPPLEHVRRGGGLGADEGFENKIFIIFL